MAHSSTTSIDRPAPSSHGGGGFAHLMPLGADAQLYCALVPDGNPVDDVEIMNTRFAGRGKNAAWLPVPAPKDRFADVFETLTLLENCAGLALHGPCQKDIVPHLDNLSPRGRIAGLADVARRTSGRSWEGDLAALDAMRRTLRSEGVAPKGARVWQIGAEGSGIAAALSMAEHGVSALTLIDDNMAAAIALASLVRAAFPRVTVSVGVPDARSIDIVVDATSGLESTGILPSSDPTRLVSGTLIVEAVARRQTGFFADQCLKAGLAVVGSDCLLIHLLSIYDEFFGWSRIPYKDGSLKTPFLAAA